MGWRMIRYPELLTGHNIRLLHYHGRDPLPNLICGFGPATGHSIVRSNCFPVLRINWLKMRAGSLSVKPWNNNSLTGKLLSKHPAKRYEFVGVLFSILQHWSTFPIVLSPQNGRLGAIQQEAAEVPIVMILFVYLGYTWTVPRTHSSPMCLQHMVPLRISCFKFSARIQTARRYQAEWRACKLRSSSAI